MARSFLVGDLHYGHKNIIKYRPQFNTVQDHDEFVHDRLLSVLDKRDCTYFCGDNAFTLDGLARIKLLPGRKICILGNHCTERVKFSDLVGVYDNIHSALSYKNFWLTHIPIHPDEMRGKRGNIHAHLHGMFINDPRYICVSLEHNDYKPFTLDQILEIASDRGI
jgi:calcineurin-like phosphoesterase family protein